MLPKIFFLRALTAFLFINGMGLEGTEPPPLKKKYNLSICAVIRNEAKYLQEWIEFHRIIGVDHFYLYNNNSKDRFQKVLNPYLRKQLVTLIQWPDLLGPIEGVRDEAVCLWALSTLIPAYENAIKYRTIKETEWLALLTTDEYLVPIESYTIRELLEKYNTWPGIFLSCDDFDASKVNLFPPKRFMIESVDITKPPTPNLYRYLPPMIVKPDQCEGFIWPPYHVMFVNNQSPLKLKRSQMRVNRYFNRDKMFAPKHKLDIDPRKLTLSELSALLEKGYVLEDEERAIYRYLPDLKNKYTLP